jgi:hypothetical protein
MLFPIGCANIPHNKQPIEHVLKIPISKPGDRERPPLYRKVGYNPLTASGQTQTGSKSAPKCLSHLNPPRSQLLDIYEKTLSSNYLPKMTYTLRHATGTTTTGDISPRRVPSPGNPVFLLYRISRMGMGPECVM